MNNPDWVNGRPLYRDREGNPLTVMEWTALYEKDENRHVAETVIGERRVSTVWLGIDHAFGNGPPLIFETMVFYAGDDPFAFSRTCVELREELREIDQCCMRYSTKAEALLFHELLCARLRTLIEDVERKGINER